MILNRIEIGTPCTVRETGKLVGIESPGNRKSNFSISSWQVKIFEKKISRRNK